MLRRWELPEITRLLELLIIGVPRVCVARLRNSQTPARAIADGWTAEKTGVWDTRPQGFVPDERLSDARHRGVAVPRFHFHFALDGVLRPRGLWGDE